MDEKGTRLMNGLLNTLASQLRTAEVEAKTGKKVEMIDLNPVIVVEEPVEEAVSVEATPEVGSYESDYANMASSEDGTAAEKVEEIKIETTPVIEVLAAVVKSETMLTLDSLKKKTPEVEVVVTAEVITEAEEIEVVVETEELVKTET
jgi:hypothetical protein